MLWHDNELVKEPTATQESLHRCSDEPIGALGRSRTPCTDMSEAQISSQIVTFASPAI